MSLMGPLPLNLCETFSTYINEPLHMLPQRQLLSPIRRRSDEAESFEL